jgi:hypothetical protein
LIFVVEVEGIANNNYRGRFFADRRANGLSEMPQDWDVHHRIPQEYMDHPEFRGFDFHAPANLRGVEGVSANAVRGVPNIHQQITNDWVSFGSVNPNATRAQIEKFASQLDRKYSRYWYR